jgi:F0F1-type ATP synthase assembly protein I
MTDFYREYLKTGAIGLEVGLSIVVGGAMGYAVEHYFDITPWGLIIGAGFGTAAAARTLYRFAKRYQKENP